MDSRVMGVLKSRKFWVSAAAVGLVLAGAFWPGINWNSDSVTAGVVLMAAFGVSLALDPGSADSKWAGMLTSRRFWATAVGLLGLLGSQVWHVELDQGGLVGYVLVISSLVVGLGIHAGDSSAKWAALLVDKRFWTAAVGLVVVFLNAFHTTLPYGLTQEQILGICVALGGYITAGSVGAQGAAAGPVVVQDVGSAVNPASEEWPFLGSK